jgi:hypothetical protein
MLFITSIVSQVKRTGSLSLGSHLDDARCTARRARGVEADGARGDASGYGGAESNACEHFDGVVWIVLGRVIKLFKRVRWRACGVMCFAE